MCPAANGNVGQKSGPEKTPQCKTHLNLCEVREYSESWRCEKDTIFLRMHFQMEEKERARTRIASRLSLVARPEGFEPPASRIGICHSIQLSYGRILLCPNTIPQPGKSVKREIEWISK